MIGSQGIPGWQVFDTEQACADMKENLLKIEEERDRMGLRPDRSHLWIGNCTELLLGQE